MLWMWVLITIHIEVASVQGIQKRPVNVYRPLTDTYRATDSLQVVVVTVTTHFMNVVLLEDFTIGRHLKPRLLAQGGFDVV